MRDKGDKNAIKIFCQHFIFDLFGYNSYAKSLPESCTAFSNKSVDYLPIYHGCSDEQLFRANLHLHEINLNSNCS